MADEPCVLVTGGASDIGLAIAERARARGVRVVLSDVVESGGVERVDVTSREDVERIVESCWSRFGLLSGLVNCATVGGSVGFLEMSDGAWEQTIGVTLRGTWLASQIFARSLISRGQTGSIVNIGSTSSVIARPGTAHYGAAKAAVNQLTRVCAIELAESGIRVNAVCPGLVDTRAGRAFAKADPKEHQTKLERVPMGRLGTPQEIAAVVDFLLSESASFLTGSVVFADGGYSCGIAKY